MSTFTDAKGYDWTIGSVMPLNKAGGNDFFYGGILSGRSLHTWSADPSSFLRAVHRSCSHDSGLPFQVWLNRVQPMALEVFRKAIEQIATQNSNAFLVAALRSVASAVVRGDARHLDFVGNEVRPWAVEAIQPLHKALANLAGESSNTKRKVA